MIPDHLVEDGEDSAIEHRALGQPGQVGVLAVVLPELADRDVARPTRRWTGTGPGRAGCSAALARRAACRRARSLSLARSASRSLAVSALISSRDTGRSAMRLDRDEQPVVGGRDAQVDGLVGVLEPLVCLGRLLRRQVEFPDPLLGAGDVLPRQVLADGLVELLVPLGVGGEEDDHVPVHPLRAAAPGQRADGEHVARMSRRPRGCAGYCGCRTTSRTAGSSAISPLLSGPTCTRANMPRTELLACAAGAGSPPMSPPDGPCSRSAWSSAIRLTEAACHTSTGRPRCTGMSPAPTAGAARTRSCPPRRRASPCRARSAAARSPCAPPSASGPSRGRPTARSAG